MQKRQASVATSSPSSPRGCGLVSASASVRRPSSASRFSLLRVSSQRVERMGLSRKLQARQSQSLGRLSASRSSATRRSAGTIAVDDDPDGSASVCGQEPSALRAPWSRLAKALPTLCCPPGRKAPATTMYSITFFPWKMEAFGYYSSPWAAAAWVPDTASMRCQICLAAFTLMRRRHHCRLCGHLVCNDCSLRRTFLPFSASTRSQHHMIRDGEPQRTCNSCANTLGNMAAQQDPRVRKLAVRPATHAGQGQVGVSRPRLWLARRSRRHTAEDEGVRQEQQQEQRMTRELTGTEPRARRLSACQADELEEILFARSLSRSRSMSKQFVVSSQWLQQWLQYVRMDPGSRSSWLALSADEDRTKRSASRPGPMANYALLDFVNGTLVPKKTLERSVAGSVDADYHVVSEDVWLAFRRLYGGGPSIQVLAPRVERSSSASETGERSLVPSFAQSGDRSEASRWVITELSELPAAVTAPPVRLAPRRNGSARFRKTELCASKKAPRSMPSSRYRRSSGARGSWAALEVKADRDSHKRWTLARALSFRASSRRLGDAASQVVEGVILYEPGTRGAPVPLRERKASSTRAAEAPSRRRERHTAVSERRLSEEADTPCSRSTIAAISAFAHAATEARRRSALSLSRHPSAHLIGPPSDVSAA